MSEHNPVQLSLDVTLSDEATFKNYYCSAHDRLALNALEQVGSQGGANNLLLWGPPGVGLSHLLQASCHHHHHSGLSAQYLPLAQLSIYNPEAVIEGLDEFALVCLDGLEHICGKSAWEQNLFHLYNRLRDRGAALVIASHQSPMQLPIALADLRSRVRGSVIYRLQGLSDAEKAQALILRAKNRGLHMSAEVAQYILTRMSRNFSDIYEVLRVLDQASLQHQRKLTIPFVKLYLA